MRNPKPLILSGALLCSSLLAAGLAAQKGFNGLEPKFVLDDPGYRVDCDNYLTVRPTEAAYWERISKATLRMSDGAAAAERVLLEKYKYMDAYASHGELIILGKPFWRFEVFGKRIAKDADGELMVPAEGEEPEYVVHRWRVDVSMRGGVKTMMRMERLPGTVVRDGEVKTLDSGVLSFDARHGDGQEVRADSRVRIHAMVLRLDGAIIRSTYDEREPMEFDLANPPIPGLKELAGARVGGKRKLVIPADLAHGAEGLPPTVPPYATLVWDIEVLRVL